MLFRSQASLQRVLGGSDILELCIQHSRMEIRELDEDRQPFQVHRFETDVRWVEEDEIADLAGRAGFVDVRVSGGYAAEPVEESSHWLVIAARRAPEGTR